MISLDMEFNVKSIESPKIANHKITVEKTRGRIKNPKVAKMTPKSGVFVQSGDCAERKKYKTKGIQDRDQSSRKSRIQKGNSLT